MIPTVHVVSPFPRPQYLRSLREALVGAGIPLDDRAPKARSAHRPFVVHVQWPDSFWSGRADLRLRRLARLVAGVRRAERSSVGRVVVTIHNFQAHEPGRLSARIQRWILDRADRLIVLSPSGVGRALDSMPFLPPERFSVALLMDGRETFTPMDPDQAAALLHVPPGDGPLVGWFGIIRPYKGLEQLARILREAPDAPVRLAVLGNPAHLTDEMSAALAVLADDPRVLLEPRRVSDDEIRALCSLADAVWLPFHSIENSASAITALAAGCPVVVPDQGSMRDLCDEYGEAFVRLYEGDLDVHGLLRLVGQPPRPTEPLLLPHRSAAAVAQQHLEIYRAALAGDPVRPRKQ